MRTSRTRLAALVAATALTTGAGAAVAADGPDRGSGRSLPTVGSGPLPGPAALYAPAPRAPQLENTGPWEAEPILVSGAQAYRDGEFLYQDFLYDDHGATGFYDNTTPYGTSAHLYSPTAGTFTYPTDPVYAHNAADLVELRVKPLARATAFRVTLNTLKDAGRTGVTVALGDGPARAWPHGAGVSSPASLFLTWHGDTAELRDAASGRVLAPAPEVQVDLERRQVELRVPHAAWDPGTATVRATVGVGLWDPAAGGYLKPAAARATATTPGGGTPTGVALVNVGPRLAEPLPEFGGATMGDTAALGAAKAPWWRDRQQSLQLTRGDVAPFAASIDFAKLAKGTDDESGVPTTGPLNRLFASGHSSGQGLDPSKVCYSVSAGFSAGAQCVGRQVGQLQPYSLYVPKGPAQSSRSLTLLLHSLSSNHNQYSASRNQAQLGERGKGSLVLTPGGRGPDGFYAGLAETDTFEAWADVARHYRLDDERVTVTGYSMGGFGTFRLLARYPDLFSRGFSVVATPGSAADQLASLRHTPLMSWTAAADELVNVASQRTMLDQLTAAGVRFEQRTFPTADHLTLAGNDEYEDGALFLGDERVDRDPARVTYVVDPREDNAAGQVVADHAYWLSGLTVRDPKKAPTGKVDVTAPGDAGPQALPLARGAGVLRGGQNQAMPYVSETLAWGAAPAAPRTDVLSVVATNVGRVVVDPARAGVPCDVPLKVTTDGPVTVELAGCGRTEQFG